jgi:inner membrane protein
MDNVTHAIAGMLIADATVELLTPRAAAPDAVLRRHARWASGIANNLPDLDFIYAYFTSGSAGYVLHHRGHTHTLGVAMCMGLVSFVVLRRLWRPATHTRREWAMLLAVSLFGPWVHIAFDFSNNYGVHPFWPVYSGWLYGDAVFIVEPLYFATTIPALALASATRAGKFLLAGIVLIGIGLAWATRFAGAGTALALMLVAAACAVATYFTPPRARTWLALALSALVTLVFFGSSHVARAHVARAAQLDAASGLELSDVSLMPAPSNPFCWSAMVVGRRREDYELLVATVSLAPNLVPTDACELEPTGHSVKLRPPSLTSTANVRWDAEWSQPLAELRALFRDNCEAHAYLRWARLPFWVFESRTRLLFGDLRYDRSPGLDFAELEGTIPPAECPRLVPPWLPPRHALLSSE